MILKGFHQDWKNVRRYARFFAEIWLIIGAAFGSVNKSFPSPWLATATIITVGCAGCLWFTWFVAVIFDRSQRKAKMVEGAGEEQVDAE